MATGGSIDLGFKLCWWEVLRTIVVDTGVVGVMLCYCTVSQLMLLFFGIQVLFVLLPTLLDEKTELTAAS
jgi:hypothetical protein